MSVGASIPDKNIGDNQATLMSKNLLSWLQIDLYIPAARHLECVSKMLVDVVLPIAYMFFHPIPSLPVVEIARVYPIICPLT